MQLAERIKTLRNGKELTQEQLAKALQVSRPTISSWETGRSYPDLMMILAIADYFGVTLDFLLREDEVIVKKLNFNSKLKKILLVLAAILGVIVANQLVSMFSYGPANGQKLDVTRVFVTRDMAYDGGDQARDWNVQLDADVKSRNPFYGVDGSNFLLRADKSGVLKGDIKGSYSLFNIFKFGQDNPVHQSVLVDTAVSSDDLKLQMNGAKESVRPQVSEINKK